MQLMLIGGSLRAGSSSTAALRTVQRLVPVGIRTDLYTDLAALPHFTPDDDSEGKAVHPAVAELRARLRPVDGVLFSTPEYAGALPGAFKNLLEWTVGSGSLYGKPAAWLNVAGPASPSGAADAHASLRTVLSYTGAAIVEAACVRVPLTRQALGEDGVIEDSVLREHVEAALETFLAHLRTTNQR